MDTGVFGSVNIPGKSMWEWLDSRTATLTGALKFWKLYMGVSKNRGTPKSSILIGFSIIIINHPIWGTPIFGNTHMNQLFTTKRDLWMMEWYANPDYGFLAHNCFFRYPVLPLKLLALRNHTPTKLQLAPQNGSPLEKEIPLGDSSWKPSFFRFHVSFGSGTGWWLQEPTWKKIYTRQIGSFHQK